MTLGTLPTVLIQFDSNNSNTCAQHMTHNTSHYLTLKTKKTTEKSQKRKKYDIDINDKYKSILEHPISQYNQSNKMGNQHQYYYYYCYYSCNNSNE